MKRIIFLIAFCLSLSAIYAQTIDVIHLKNGFDARGTITNRTDSQITLQSENGRTLTIDMSEIESMEQEQKAFDPRVLIGRWAYHTSSGERDEKYDIVISENQGFYIISYNGIVAYMDDGNNPFPPNPFVQEKHIDIDPEKGEISFYYNRVQSSFLYYNSRRKYEIFDEREEREYELKYVDGKLKGNVNCLRFYSAMGNSNYKYVDDALQHGSGQIYHDGPCGNFKCYFIKKY